MENFFQEELNDTEQIEIQVAIIQYLTGLLLHVREEYFQLFINYLQKIPTITFKNLDAIFAREEYRKDKGNLSHVHMMIKTNWQNMTQPETDCVNDLVRD